MFLAGCPSIAGDVPISLIGLQSTERLQRGGSSRRSARPFRRGGEVFEKDARRGADRRREGKDAETKIREVAQ